MGSSRSRRRRWYSRGHYIPRPASAQNVTFINWVGVMLAAAGVAIALLGYQSAQINNLRSDVIGEGRESREYFVNHLSEHGVDAVAAADLAAAAILDRDAVAILEGAGPDEWPLSSDRALNVAEELSVDSWKIVQPVYPDGDRLRPDVVCGIDEHGKLIVRGFSREREAALVEYLTGEETAGVPCETDTFFFYLLSDLRSELDDVPQVR